MFKPLEDILNVRIGSMMISFLPNPDLLQTASQQIESWSFSIDSQLDPRGFLALVLEIVEQYGEGYQGAWLIDLVCR